VHFRHRLARAHQRNQALLPAPDRADARGAPQEAAAPGREGSRAEVRDELREGERPGDALGGVRDPCGRSGCREGAPVLRGPGIGKGGGRGGRRPRNEGGGGGLRAESTQVQLSLRPHAEGLSSFFHCEGADLYDRRLRVYTVLRTQFAESNHQRELDLRLAQRVEGRDADRRLLQEAIIGRGGFRGWRRRAQ